MGLIFMWIENYKKLDNFQTNFGGKYQLFFKNNILTIEENDQYINDFFKIKNYETSISMSTIVGENGTGKSSILDFITHYINERKSSFNFIMVFESDNVIYIDSKYKKIKIESKVNDLKHIQSGKQISTQILSNLNTLFFSNVFDIRYFEHIEKNEFNYYSKTNSKNVKNISTNSLLGKYENVSAFLKQDASHQIFFVNEYKEKLEMDKLLTFPDKIMLDLEPLDDYYNIATSNIHSLIEEISLKEFLSDYSDFDSDIVIKQNMIRRFFQYYCIDVAEVLGNNNISDENVKNAYYSSNGSYSSFLQMIHNSLLKLVKENYEKKYSKIKSELREVSSRYSKIIKAIKQIDIIENGNGYFISEVDISSQHFIALYRKHFYEKRILNFHWSEMSSGQLSLLNLFGRFYNALYELNIEGEESSSSVKRNYLLILDECDLYFHPQWQKDWLFHFLRMVEILFNGHVQVILTTHSPFILSDFPNSNVTFLSKQKGSNIGEIEGSPRTFGANINELLTNSFFINDGLMGKFAKNKINNFISVLISTPPDKIEENKVAIKRFIDIVGEPIIKNKLIQIFNDKIALSQDQTLEYRIELLEKELNKLKELKVKK